MSKSFTITTKQAYTLFLLASFSPLIRLTSALGARLGGSAAWVSIIISCAVYYGLIALLGLYFKRNCNNPADLYSLYKSAFGKVISKVLVLVYAVWVFVLAAFYLRAFAERFAGAIMPGVPVGFFTVTVLALVFVILSGRLQSFALLGEIFFYLILCVIAVVFLFQASKIRPENLLPVTIYDAGGIISGTLPTIGVFAYIAPLLFLFSEVKDNVKDSDKERGGFRRYGFYSALVLLSVNLIVFVVTVGVFGSELTGTLSQPFLMSVKTIGILDSLERLESVFLLLFVVTDLALVVMLMYVLLRLIDLFTGCPQNVPGFRNYCRTPLICGLYILSLFIARLTAHGGAQSSAQAMRGAEAIALPLNIILGVLVPATAVLVWVLRLRLRQKNTS